MAEQIVEVPLEASPLIEPAAPTETPTAASTAAPTDATPTDVAPTEPVVPKKRTGRPKGSKDTKPRARPKARPAADARPKARPAVDALPVDPPSDDASVDASVDASADGDDATLREIGMMHLLRSVHQYRGAQQDKRQKLYAGWLGR